MSQADRTTKRRLSAACIGVLVRCSRQGLLQTTALQAAAAITFLPLLTVPALAQLAPNARPTGGNVVAGQASISQSAAETTINQTSQRAAINWQSFNIGSQQQVDFQQPSSSSVTLNRVVGPDPSEIAGQIHANGQIVLVNQAGVVFDHGSQVDTAGLVVTAAGISNSNFMAGGRMKFDQPANPGATVVNNGSITISNQGLAALVAPQVANSGVIKARMGSVVLAGAEAATLDLYGDGLVSLNVTRQVHSAPDGTKALVTNTGAIAAAGGTIVLTAEAVDGVIQNLVNAGGKIAADSVAGRTGRVIISGRGGDVEVIGSVAAVGAAPGTKGGDIVVNTTGTVTLASGAGLNASGRAGGGTVAVGTTLARAKGGAKVTPTLSAASVTMQQGATIAANATAKGNGGRVAVMSATTTTLNGAILARGGPSGGNGGMVETSSDGTLSIAGSAVVDASAPRGTAGLWYLDPRNIIIDNGGIALGAGGTTAGGDTFTNRTAGTDRITATSISKSLNGGTDVTLQAINDLTLDAGSPITATTGSGNLNLQAGEAISINANITLKGSFTAAANDAAGVSGAGADQTKRGSNPGGFTMAAGTTIDTSAGASSVINISVGPATTVGGTAFPAGPITLAGLKTGSSGNLVVSVGSGASTPANGSISQTSDVVTIGGTSSFTVATSGATITLNTPTNALTGAVTLNTTGAGSDASLTNGVATGTTLAANTGIGGNLVVVNTLGNLSQTGALTVKGTSSFTDSASGATITLTEANALTGAVTLNTNGAGSDASLTNGVATGTTLAANTGIGGNLVVLNTLGNLSQTGVLTVTGTSSFTDSAAGGTITLAQTNALTGAVALNTNGAGSDVSLTNDVATGTTLAANTGIGGNLVVVNTLGNLSQTGALTVTGTSSFTDSAAGGTITLAKANALTGAVALNTNGAGSDASLTNDVATGTTLAANTGIGGNLVVVNTLGNLSQTGVLTVTGTSSFTDSAAGGTITLARTNALTGAVALNTNGAGSDVSLTNDVATGTTLAANTGIGGNLVVVNTLGNLSQTGALTVTGTSSFTGSASGATITLTEANALTGAVALNSNGAGSDVSLTNDVATGTTLAANTGIGGNLVVVNTLGNLSQTGGLTVTGTSSFTDSASGATITLTEANALTGAVALNTNGAGSDVSLTNSVATTLAASTIGGGLTVTTTNGAGLTLGAAVTVTGTVTLNSAGTIDQTGGVLSATTLFAMSDGGASLLDSNQIADLGSATNTTSGGFALADGQALDVLGPVTAPGNIYLASSAAGGVTIAATGTVSATGTGALAGFQADSFINGGSVSAGTYEVAPFHSGSLLTIGAGGATLGAFTANDLRFGAVTMPGTVAPVTTAGSIVIVGTLGAPAVNIELDSKGDIGEASGATLVAATLTGSAGGNVTLVGTVGTLGSFGAGGNFSLNDGTALNVLGTVTAGSTATLGLTAAGSLAIGNSATAGVLNAGTVALTASGTISEDPNKGTIIASVLTGPTIAGSSAAAVNLADNANAIGTLASFVTPGSFVLNDGTVLAVAGPVNGGTSATIVDAQTLTVNGSLFSNGTMSLTGSNITITGSGYVSDGGLGSTTLIATGGTIGEIGTLIAGTLSGRSTGATSLAGATTITNRILNLGSFTAAGFLLNDGTALAVAGPVSGGTSAVILDSQSLTVNGSVFSTDAISLTGSNVAINGTGFVSDGGSGTTTLVANGGPITETGTLAAGTLTGSSTGETSLTGATASTNQVANLGSFTANGFTLNDGLALVVAGAVNGGSNVTILESQALTVTGNLASTNGMNLTGGSFTIAGSGVVSDGGNGSTSLTAIGGAITDTGALIAGTLTGGSFGATELKGATPTTNQVATLSDFSANDFTLNNGAVLTVTGHVSGGSAGVALTNSTTLTQVGTSSVTGTTVSETAAFGTFAQGGTVAASVGGATLASSNGNLVQTGIVTGHSGTTSLSASGTSGSLTQGGRVTGATVIQTATAGLSQSGTTTATSGNLSSITTAGSLVQSGSLFATSGTIITGVGTIDPTAMTGATGSASSGALTVTPTGSIAANVVFIFDPGEPISAGGAFALSPVSSKLGNPLLAVSLADFPKPLDPGLYITGQSVTLLAKVVPASQVTHPDVTVRVTGGGVAAFDQFSAPATDLWLQLDGHATTIGQIFVAGLHVAYDQPTQSLVDLSGTVGGQSGSGAAQASHIAPAAKNNYEMNGCPIQSINCIRIPTTVLPVLNPLNDINYGLPPPVDVNLLLPDVAERDY